MMGFFGKKKSANPEYDFEQSIKAACKAADAAGLGYSTIGGILESYGASYRRLVAQAIEARKYRTSPIHLSGNI
jgi:hypothetical protein